MAVKRKTASRTTAKSAKTTKSATARATNKSRSAVQDPVAKLEKEMAKLQAGLEKAYQKALKVSEKELGSAQKTEKVAVDRYKKIQQKIKISTQKLKTSLNLKSLRGSNKAALKTANKAKESLNELEKTLENAQAAVIAAKYTKNDALAAVHQAKMRIKFFKQSNKALQTVEKDAKTAEKQLTKKLSELMLQTEESVEKIKRAQLVAGGKLLKAKGLIDKAIESDSSAKTKQSTKSGKVKAASSPAKKSTQAKSTKPAKKTAKKTVKKAIKPKKAVVIKEPVGEERVSSIDGRAADSLVQKTSVQPSAEKALDSQKVVERMSSSDQQTIQSVQDTAEQSSERRVFDPAIDL